MSKKLLYLKVVTANEDYRELIPVQIAIYLKSPIITVEKVFQLRPCYQVSSNTEVHLKKYNLDTEVMQGYPEPQVVYKQIKSLFKGFVNPYNPTDKMTCVGYRLVEAFTALDRLFKFCNDSYLFSFIDSKNCCDFIHMSEVFNNTTKDIKMPYDFPGICAYYDVPLKQTYDPIDELAAYRRLYKIFEPIFERSV